MNCIFCQSSTFVLYRYPKYHFNGSIFEYKRCAECRLVQLSPMPETADYDLMYPASYQDGGANTIVNWQMGVALSGLRFPYKQQLELIEKFVSKSANILDYGCGNANFLVNAADYGFNSLNGAEFGQEIVGVLKMQLPKMQFYTIQEILSNLDAEGFDCIRLSNVLEHLTDPSEILQVLKSKLNHNGILVLEGPLEDNFYPMNVLNRIYFTLRGLIKKSSVSDQPPYHIFFANYRNQLELMENAGYKTIYCEVIENSWPYPNSWKDSYSLTSKVYFLLSKLSRQLTSLGLGRWGNTILYIGQK